MARSEKLLSRGRESAVLMVRLPFPSLPACSCQVSFVILVWPHLVCSLKNCSPLDLRWDSSKIVLLFFNFCWVIFELQMLVELLSRSLGYMFQVICLSLFKVLSRVFGVLSWFMGRSIWYRRSLYLRCWLICLSLFKLMLNNTGYLFKLN